MRIGLIDVDGHRFPNLALMRISSYYKERGDAVEWYQPSLFGTWYDIVYMTKVFSAAYTPDEPEPMNADVVIKGGTGYAITLVNGKEVYDKAKDPPLPAEIEKCYPDYSLYPQYDFAVALTSRGCPRGCGFCHVAEKEGRCSVKVADLASFWQQGGQKRIQCLDPNITACKDKRDLFAQYKATDARILFNQGLDIRLIDDDDIHDLNTMKLEALHFAWDNPQYDLQERFRHFSQMYTGVKRDLTEVFCLTNYEDCSVEEHIERALYRVYKLQEINGEYNPYIMIYDKPHADRRLWKLQRWCNNKFIYRSCPRFEDYVSSKSALLKFEDEYYETLI